MKNNKLHWEGVNIWNDASKYLGRFKENKKNGEGIYVWPNGDMIFI